jgi:hypothetical protein
MLPAMTETCGGREAPHQNNVDSLYRKPKHSSLQSSTVLVQKF